MYFQVEVDYYSNKTNENKYANFQLIASINKKQLKYSWRLDCTGHCTCNDNLSYFVAWTLKYFLLGLVVTWKHIFQVQVIFVWARHKSLYIHINTIYVNKNQQGHS